jgi:trans-aconitate 2-methyltransferase
LSAEGSRRTINSGPREWDAETYDAVSDPQFEWGMEVLDRVELRGEETVLDAGCGSGRVTERLADRLPRGRVIAVDGSRDMIEKARERLGERATYLVTDLLELDLEEPVDLIFSTATFHWIVDHDLLFRRLHAALVDGGRLVAQCGGDGNVADYAAVIRSVMARPQFARHFEGMDQIWNFAGAEETEGRLRAAGFEQVRCWLEPKPVTPENPIEFASVVTLGPHLARLPDDLERPFVEAVVEQSGTPFSLDYVRLNIEARA